jgi:hypothetical protein
VGNSDGRPGSPLAAANSGKLDSVRDLGRGAAAICRAFCEIRCDAFAARDGPYARLRCNEELFGGKGFGRSWTPRVHRSGSSSEQKISTEEAKVRVSLEITSEGADQKDGREVRSKPSRWKYT